MMTTNDLALDVKDIVKSYGATKALAGASFSVRAGSVHALLGENGAGKSTMIKLLSGAVQPDAGTITVHGQTVKMRGPRDAHRIGLQTAFQELTLVPDLTVLQNMLLPYEPYGIGGQLRHRTARRAIADHLRRMGLGFVDFRKDVREFDLNLRQRIEIARAVFRQPRVLFLDEATSALAGGDIEWLGELIARLKAEGVTIVFITHRMPEVRRFCDSVTVLRNGRDVGTYPVAAIEDRMLIELIMGRSMESAFPPKPTRAPDGPVLLSVDRIATAARLSECSFDLRAGEILGVAALQGMGQQELFLSLFGALPLAKGEVTLNGQPIVLASPIQAIGLGIGLVPEERKIEGLFLKLTGRENVMIPALERFTRFGLLDDGAEVEAASAVMKRVQVDRRALYAPAAAFSGGNQQKLVLAKWLVAQTRILLLFDPCRGVDVGTKFEIYLLIRSHVEAGGAVLIYSTEIPELVNLCDRVLVMYSGRVSREIAGRDGVIEELEVMEAVLGGSALSDPSPGAATPGGAS